MDFSEITTEYLILHENEIDWEALSSCDKRPLSLVEIRLFRKHIIWKKYLYTHGAYMSDEMLDIASKYFTKANWSVISLIGLGSEAFALKHRTEIHLPVYIIKAHPSEDFLLETIDQWWNDDDVKDEVYEYIKNSDDFNSIKLLFETQNFKSLKSL